MHHLSNNPDRFFLSVFSALRLIPLTFMAHINLPSGGLFPDHGLKILNLTSLDPMENVWNTLIWLLRTSANIYRDLRIAQVLVNLVTTNEFFSH